MPALSGRSARRAVLWVWAQLLAQEAARLGHSVPQLCAVWGWRRWGSTRRAGADGGSGAVVGARALDHHNGSSVLSGLCTSQGTAVWKSIFLTNLV